MKSIIVAIAITFGLVSHNCFAAWEGPRDIQWVYSGSTGGRNAISLVGGNPNPDGCTNNFDLMVDAGNPDFNTIWSIILTSYSLDRPIYVYLKGCDAVRGLPLITDVRLHRVGQ